MTSLSDDRRAQRQRLIVNTPDFSSRRRWNFRLTIVSTQFFPRRREMNEKSLSADRLIVNFFSLYPIPLLGDAIISDKTGQATQLALDATVQAPNNFRLYSVSKIGARFIKSEDFMKRNYNSLVVCRITITFNFQIFESSANSVPRQ